MRRYSGLKWKTLTGTTDTSARVTRRAIPFLMTGDTFIHVEARLRRMMARGTRTIGPNRRWEVEPTLVEPCSTRPTRTEPSPEVTGQTLRLGSMTPIAGRARLTCFDAVKAQPIARMNLSRSQAAIVTVDAFGFLMAGEAG